MACEDDLDACLDECLADGVVVFDDVGSDQCLCMGHMGDERVVHHSDDALSHAAGLAGLLADPVEGCG